MFWIIFFRSKTIPNQALLPSPGAAARGQIQTNDQPQSSNGLRPKKSFWKSISGIFRTKSAKKKKQQQMQQKLDEKQRLLDGQDDTNKNVEDSSKEDAMMSAEKKRNTKDDKGEEDSSEEDHVIVKVCKYLPGNICSILQVAVTGLQEFVIHI